MSESFWDDSEFRRQYAAAREKGMAHAQAKVDRNNRRGVAIWAAGFSLVAGSQLFSSDTAHPVHPQHEAYASVSYAPDALTAAPHQAEAPNPITSITILSHTALHHFE